MRGVVVIAEGNQRANLQAAACIPSVRPGFVSNHDRVFAVDKEHAFFDLDFTRPIGEYREGVETERVQITIALGMDCASVLVGAQLKALAVNDERIFEFREQHKPADRRLGGCNQQPMIAPGVEINDAGGGESADAVGLDPLARGGLGEIAANLGYRTESAEFIL